jgi:hypothetical protein
MRLDMHRKEMRAGIAADSIFYYFGIFVDDIGDIILLAYGDKPDNYARKLDSFNAVKTQIAKQPKYSALRPFFNALGSWYDLGLKPLNGVRQRITHFEDIIVFGAGKVRENEPWKAVAFIHAFHDTQKPAGPDDIVEIIKEMFAALFEWLDPVYEVLLSKMKARNLVDEAEWTWVGTEARFHVGTFKPENPSVIPSHYLYLNLIEGSDPFDFNLIRVE